MCGREGIRPARGVQHRRRLADRHRQCNQQTGGDSGHRCLQHDLSQHPTDRQPQCLGPLPVGRRHLTERGLGRLGDIRNTHHRQHQHPGRQGKSPIKVHHECQIADVAEHNRRDTRQHFVSPAQDGVRSAGGEFGQVDPGQHAHGATHQHDPDAQDRGTHDRVAQTTRAAMRVLHQHAPVEHRQCAAEDSDQHPQRGTDHHRQTAEACGPPQRVDDLASSSDRPMPRGGRRFLPGARRRGLVHLKYLARLVAPYPIPGAPAHGQPH